MDKDGDNTHTGGPAYPPCGLTIRDYFAGQALAGMAGLMERDKFYLVKRAYAVADAMLAERER